MGTIAMKLPRHPALRVLGFRPDAEKQDALAGATALVMPSPHESFSFVILEAWSQSTPVLATARSPVLRGHVARSGAGLLFDQAPDDLGAAVGMLIAALCKTLGERGRAYVEARYRWPRITRQYVDFLAHVFGGSAA
jgi:glycosyltransferase involved in cell wall biosynthesis